MMTGGYRFLFGPVRSRRLGRSLGVDLVPLKVCTYDCPYCQVGKTTDKTIVRREYVPVEGVLAEFDDWMAHDGQADCVTLAGGGEPTLHSRFGEIIDAIGTRCKLRRILLSNGSLFSQPDARSAATKAEVVKATLSAWDQTSFEAVHHPHASLKFDVFLDGLKAFRREFSREYWLEVFVVPGVNDETAQMLRIADLAEQIKPDRIHLNTAVRPAQDSTVKPVASSRMDELARLFRPVAEVIGVVVANASAASPAMTADELAERTLSLIQRHPVTTTDLCATLGVGLSEVESAITILMVRGVIRIEGGYYVRAIDI
ncbi:MAG: radical SAM protein [bacterium]|jgi:wyosine [tRNA(Phe)-imidazoG37] synthetase (radical SAM superfamily)